LAPHKLYIEGVAIRGGPESCAGVREGVGEALAGVRVGWAMEPRNQRSGVPMPYNEAEGNIVGLWVPETPSGTTPRPSLTP
jgi:hypothetical protein